MKNLPYILFVVLLIFLVFLGLSTDSLAYDVNADIDNVISFITSSSSFRTELTRLGITLSDLPYYAIYNNGTDFYYVFSQYPIVTNGVYFFYTGYKIEGLLFANNSISVNGNYNTDYQNPNYRLGNFNNNNYAFNFIGQTIKINYNMYGYSNNAVNDTVYFSQNVSVPLVLTSISITSLPTKLDYIVGDNLDSNGLVVVANYDNNSFEEITDTDYSLSPTVLNDTGNITITVSYLDKTTSFVVFVAENQGTGILQRIYSFFANFWDNLLHFFIPTDNQILDIRSYFNEKVLSLFGFSSWSYSAGDYDYSYDAFTPIEPPIFDINFLGSTFTFDTQDIVDFLDTPVTFGKSMTDLEHYGNLPTGNLTARKIISLILSIEMFVLNIVLYNKFFSKGD